MRKERRERRDGECKFENFWEIKKEVKNANYHLGKKVHVTAGSTLISS